MLLRASTGTALHMQALASIPSQCSDAAPCFSSALNLNGDGRPTARPPTWFLSRDPDGLPAVSGFVMLDHGMHLTQWGRKSKSYLLLCHQIQLVAPLLQCNLASKDRIDGMERRVILITGANGFLGKRVSLIHLTLPAKRIPTIEPESSPPQSTQIRISRAFV